MNTPDLVAAVILLCLVVYVLTACADFGGGIWELFARGPRAEQQRLALGRAIAPVWEAHHVWMIIVVVLLFVCFPVAFSGIMTALHIPIVGMLIGIVLRGSAFVFRSYSAGDRRIEERAGRIFAISSAASPFLLGVIAGAVASGRIRIDPVTAVVRTDFVSEWLAPFPLAVGALTVVLSAYLAAVYMTVEATDDALREDFRTRALGSAVVLGAVAALSMLLARSGRSAVASDLLGSAWAGPFHAVTALAAVGAIAALWSRRHTVARALAMVQCALIVLGWGGAQYPFLVAPDLTIQGAAAPETILQSTLAVLAGGSALLLPAFLYLYRIFKLR